VGAVSPVERVLRWEGCYNVRDLGGLETASGGRTRHGSVVRADNVRRLTVAGWEEASRHGVRRVLDLRFDTEAVEQEALPGGIELVAVSLFGTYDAEHARTYEERVRASTDVAPIFAAGYVRTLEEGSDRVASAVAAVADADASGTVVVHCFAGKDRTGIVTALLLSLAGVPDEVVASDYAASGPGVEILSQSWFDEAETDDELAFRRRMCASPAAAMTGVLGWLRESHGGAESYLRGAGLTGAQVEALRHRLVG